MLGLKHNQTNNPEGFLIYLGNINETHTDFIKYPHPLLLFVQHLILDLLLPLLAHSRISTRRIWWWRGWRRWAAERTTRSSCRFMMFLLSSLTRSSKPRVTAPPRTSSSRSEDHCNPTQRFLLCHVNIKIWKLLLSVIDSEQSEVLSEHPEQP